MRLDQRIKHFLYNSAAHAIIRLGLDKQLLCPALKQYKNLPENRRSILFVCKGNICRSAYAKAKMDQILKQNPTFNIPIYSAGTTTSDGLPADSKAIEVASSRNIDLSLHRTTLANKQNVGEAGLIVVMDTENLKLLKKLDQNVCKKSVYLGALGLNKSQHLIIKDPYGKPTEVFHECFDRIDHSLEELARLISAGVTTHVIQQSSKGGVLET